MATQSSSTKPDNSTDANFRAWGKSVSDTILALGWVRDPVSAANHINWNTVLKPGVVWSQSGFEVFMMNDSLAATYPVYLKIIYGCSGSLNYPFLFVQIGTTVDANGALGGYVSNNFQASTTSSDSSNSYVSRASGGPNTLVYFLWASWSYKAFFSVERTHDSNGNDTGDGALLLVACSGGTYSHYVPFSGSPPGYQSYWNGVLPPSGTGANGTDVYLYPIRAWGRGETCPSLNVFLYFNVDLTVNNALTATTWDGVAHNIFPTGLTFASTSYGGSSVIAMRWY